MLCQLVSYIRKGRANNNLGTFTNRFTGLQTQRLQERSSKAHNIVYCADCEIVAASDPEHYYGVESTTAPDEPSARHRGPV